MRSRLLVNMFLASNLVLSTTAGCFVRSVNPPVPDITGLTSLGIAPQTTKITLERTRNGYDGTQQLTATGIINGVSEDMTTRVQWTSNLPGASVSTTGVVTLAVPGTYTITATNGTVAAIATVIAIEPEWK